MKKYDYKMLTISVPHLNKDTFRSELAENFTELGSKGWEMIELKPILRTEWLRASSFTSEFLVVFKKEIN